MSTGCTDKKAALLVPFWVFHCHLSPMHSVIKWPLKQGWMIYYNVQGRVACCSCCWVANWSLTSGKLTVSSGFVSLPCAAGFLWAQSYPNFLKYKKRKTTMEMFCENRKDTHTSQQCPLWKKWLQQAKIGNWKAKSTNYMIYKARSKFHFFIYF